jgi:hypothetical protein
MNTTISTPKTTIKPLAKSAQSPLSIRQFADRVKDVLSNRDARRATEVILGADTDPFAVKKTYTFYDEDRRKWVITETLAHDGFKEAFAKTMYPYTDGSYADFDGSAVGTRKGWFEWNTAWEEWRGVNLFGDK